MMEITMLSNNFEFKYNCVPVKNVASIIVFSYTLQFSLNSLLYPRNSVILTFCEKLN